MENGTFIQKICGGLIVSCQALDDEPLYGTGMMPLMARAVAIGGAVGIRANGADDIRKIRAEVAMPLIGIVKRNYAGSSVYITPTFKEVEEVAHAGADVVALDATSRTRPGRETLEALVRRIRAAFPELLIMADVSTLEEGLAAAELGVDVVASTLSGYTPYSPQRTEPDFALIESLVRNTGKPVIAEGRIHTPDEALRCIQLGCVAVVVGSAITRPQEITRLFVEKLRDL